MAKTKRANTVLRLRDEVSGGLIKLAKNTRTVTHEMQAGIRDVVQFKARAQASIAAVVLGFDRLRTAVEDAFAAKIGRSDAFGLDDFRYKLGTVTADCFRVGQSAQRMHKNSAEWSDRFTGTKQPTDTMAMHTTTWVRHADKRTAVVNQSYHHARIALTDAKLVNLRRQQGAGIHPNGWKRVDRMIGSSVASLHSKPEQATEAVSTLAFANPIMLAIENLTTAGTRILGRWNAVKDTADRLYGGGKTHFAGIKERVIGAFTRNALGTSYWRGGLTRVHERGGEIMNLPSGTQIIPHDVSMRMAGDPQVSVQVVVQGNIIGNRQFADEMGETIWERIRKALDNM